MITWNVTLVVTVAGIRRLGGWTFGLAGTSGVISFRYYTFSWPWQTNFYFTVNQLQIEKSPKLTQKFKWNNNLCIIIIYCVPYQFHLIFKRFTCYCFVATYYIIISIIFISTIMHLVSIIIPQTSRCHKIIVTIF